MHLTWNTILVLVGCIFEVVGAVIVTLDALKNRKETLQLEDFRWYVESLDQSLKELEKEKEEPPLPLAATTVEGINIPEAFEIMRKGVKEANEINRKKLLDMMKEASDAADRSKFMVYLGSACVILGAVMHLFLWFLSPGGEH